MNETVKALELLVSCSDQCGLLNESEAILTISVDVGTARRRMGLDIAKIEVDRGGWNITA